MEGVNTFVMDYKEERRLAWHRQNKRNKDRSKSMERRIAQFLGGNRVPMSGAGSLKGDGLVYFDRGLYIIECKSSSMITNQKRPKMRINFEWLTKLESDVRAMRARFGILVMHYHRTRHNYVVMRLDWFREYVNDVTPVADGYITTKNGINLEKDKLDKHRGDNPVISLTTPFGEYVIMLIEDFKAWLEARKSNE